MIIKEICKVIILLILLLFFVLFINFAIKWNLDTAKSYYSKKEQKLIKIVCLNESTCWKNETKILQITKLCKDDVDCWKSVNVIINL